MKEYLFLSREWIIEATRAIEEAKRVDEEFRELARGFTLTVAYIVKNLPRRLRELYGSDVITILIKLEEGVLKKLEISPGQVKHDADFRVESDYEVAKKLFSGELSAGSAFVKKKISVGPISKLYMNPAFTARSLVTASKMLKIMARVPTKYPDEAN